MRGPFRMALCQSHLRGFGCVDDSRVVSGENAILRADEHANFGATENHTFGTAVLHLCNDSLVFLAGRVENFAEA